MTVRDNKIKSKSTQLNKTAKLFGITRLRMLNLCFHRVTRVETFARSRRISVCEIKNEIKSVRMCKRAGERFF